MTNPRYALLNKQDDELETIPAAVIGLMAEGVAVLMFFAAAFVWLV